MQRESNNCIPNLTILTYSSGAKIDHLQGSSKDTLLTPQQLASLNRHHQRTSRSTASLHLKGCHRKLLHIAPDPTDMLLVLVDIPNLMERNRHRSSTELRDHLTSLTSRIMHTSLVLPTLISSRLAISMAISTRVKSRQCHVQMSRSLPA